MQFIQSFMNNLTYPKKMLLISLVFMVPIVISNYILLAQSNEKVNHSALEQDGLVYIKNVRQLYQHLPQHRGMTNAFRNGKKEFEAKILAKREAIIADIAAIDAVDAEFGKKFKTTALWEEIKQDWQNLKSKAFTANSKQVFDEHSQLIKKVHLLMEKASNKSNLILDPEITAHFIIDSIIYKLPTVTEYLGQARGFGSGVIASGIMTTDKQIKLGTLLARINAASSDAEHDFELVFEDSPELITELEDLMTARTKAMNEFMSVANNQVLKGNFDYIDSASFFALGTEAIKANYKIYDALIPVLDQQLEQRIGNYRSHQLQLTALIFITIILATLLFMSFYNSIVSSIKRLNQASTIIASGDLTAEAESKTNDEVKEIFDSLNDMTSKLSSTMAQLQSNSFSLAESAEQLSSSTQQVTTNITGQQSQTEHIASSMTEMTATVQDIAQNAELLALEVSKAEDETSTGSQIINSTITSIGTLAEGVGNASNAVASLEVSSNEIGSILNVIKEVAEQTNLLALNAAIEAARAGDHGRGFAVVADEVRSLANRTQQSAEQIQEMVNTLQQNTREATSVMAREKQKAEEVSVKTQEATTSIESIVESMKNIADMSTQVATAAEEQSAVSEEISRNVTMVSELSANNLSSTEDVSNSSNQLAKLAADLDFIVKQFKVKS